MEGRQSGKAGNVETTQAWTCLIHTWLTPIKHTNLRSIRDEWRTKSRTNHHKKLLVSIDTGKVSMLSAKFTSHENQLMQVHKEHTHLGNWGWWKEGGAPIRLFCLESAGNKRRACEWFCSNLFKKHGASVSCIWRPLTQRTTKQQGGGVWCAFVIQFKW